MSASTDPCDKFGAAFANLVQHLNAKEANAQSKAVRNSDIDWPVAPELRWQAAARIGRDYGKELVGKRLPGVSDPALARAINEHTLAEAAKEMGTKTYNPNARTSIEDVLRDKGLEITNSVHALISFGRVAEVNAHAQANALQQTPNAEVEARLAQDVSEFLPAPRDDAERGAWLMEASRTRMAMAQTGLLSPEATVAAAIDARATTQMRVGAIAVIDRRAAGEADPAERLQMLETARRHTMFLAYGTADPQQGSRAKDTALLEAAPLERSREPRPAPALMAAMTARRGMGVA